MQLQFQNFPNYSIMQLQFFFLPELILHKYSVDGVNTERHICGSFDPIVEVRETSCWALDLEFEADREVAHELHFQCDLRQVASLLAQDLFPPPRGHRLALDSVSFIVDTIRA